jgi:hypothetical protein
MKGKGSAGQQKRQPPGKLPNTCLYFLVFKSAFASFALDFIAFLLPRSGLVQPLISRFPYMSHLLPI